jgi:hypothetical protein
MWQKPVCIESVYQDKPILLRHDGKEAKVHELGTASSDAVA